MTLEKIEELVAGKVFFQDICETFWLCSILEKYALRHALRNVLEIGVAEGASLKIWEYLLESDGLLVGIDNDSMVKASEYAKSVIAQSLKDVKFILGSSTDPETFRQAQLYFPGQIVDFLFIDSNHQYETTRKEYLMYGPMVKPGGIIAFHDVYQGYLGEQIWSDFHPLGCGVFWKELKAVGDLEIDEFTQANGMGVIFKQKADLFGELVEPH